MTQSFDVADTDRRYRVAFRFARNLTTMAMVATFFFGAVFAVWGALGSFWILAGIGLVVIAFGALVSSRSIPSSRRRLEAVEVDESGLKLRFDRGPVVVGEWRSPRLRVTIVDMRASRIAQFAAIPATLSVSQDLLGEDYGGISLEAFRAVLTSALAARVRAVEHLDSQNGRMVVIGKARRTNPPYWNPVTGVDEGPPVGTFGPLSG